MFKQTFREFEGNELTRRNNLSSRKNRYNGQTYKVVRYGRQRESDIYPIVLVETGEEERRQTTSGPARETGLRDTWHGQKFAGWHIRGRSSSRRFFSQLFREKVPDRKEKRICSGRLGEKEKFRERRRRGGEKRSYARGDAINWYCLIGYRTTQERTQRERGEQRIRVSRTNPNVVSWVLFMYTYTYADVNTRRQRSVEIYHPRDWISQNIHENVTYLTQSCKLKWGNDWNTGWPGKKCIYVHDIFQKLLKSE